MKKWKRLIGPLLVLFLVAIGVVCIIFWKEETVEENILLNRYDGEGEEYILENEYLKFVLDGSTTQFAVEQKSNGMIWYSNPEGAAEDTKALLLERENLQSTFLLDYSTANGVDTQYNNYGYSIEKGLYEIVQEEDCIRIEYSVGDVEKEYNIPPVIREERFLELIGAMGDSEAKRTKGYYKKYDINKLSKKDNKEELLQNFPILETEVVYILRDTTKDNMKAAMEEYMAEAGYTAEELAEDKKLDTRVKVSDRPIFNICMEYRLEGNELIVELPYEDMEYKSKYPLHTLTVLPYFGAGGKEDEGYLMVPEGSGALIRFNNGKTSQAAYYANVYGWDMAVDREAVVHETRTSFGAFGIGRNGGGVLCILDQGAPYAAIQADVAGKKNSYNYANAIYTIVHRDQFDVTERYNGAMFLYEQQLPEESLVQRYCFEETADYAEMAESYREYMQKESGVVLEKKDNTDTQVVVEVISAIDKVKQILGMPVSRPYELTSYEETGELITELSEAGIDNLSVKLSGWFNGGMKQSLLTKVKLERCLGGKKDFREMMQTAEALEVPIYLDGITNYAYNSDLLDGFFVYTDAARMVTKEVVEIYPYSAVTYAKWEDRDPHYLLHPELIGEMVDTLTDTAGRYKAGVSFRDIGSELSADYYRKAPVSRQAAMEWQKEKLQEIGMSGMDIMINGGNDYAVLYADVITDMKLQDSSYGILDQMIPFYPMVLHGYVDYTGNAINLAANPEKELLISAEYGANLFFALMQESSVEVQDTSYTRYFGADASVWSEKLIDIYQSYNEKLGHTFSLQMSGHRYLTDTLTCTEYEDGTAVYVNYGYEEAVLEDGSVVPARDYTVVR